MPTCATKVTTRVLTQNWRLPDFLCTNRKSECGRTWFFEWSVALRLTVISPVWFRPLMSAAASTVDLLRCFPSSSPGAAVHGAAQADASTYE